MEELHVAQKCTVPSPTFGAISKKFPFSGVLPPQVPQCSRTTAQARLQGRWFTLVKARELSKSLMSSACYRNIEVSLEKEEKRCFQ